MAQGREPSVRDPIIDAVELYLDDEKVSSAARLSLLGSAIQLLLELNQCSPTAAEDRAAAEDVQMAKEDEVHAVDEQSMEAAGGLFTTELRVWGYELVTQKQLIYIIYIKLNFMIFFYVC